MTLTDNKNIIKLVRALGEGQLSVKEMMAMVGLKDRENFLILLQNLDMISLKNVRIFQI